MCPSAPFLNPHEAAKRLGVSAKALRLYEQRGLIAPGRTAAGWRVYGPDAMAKAADIVALRNLGLGLADVARVLKGDATCLKPALAAHQAALERQARSLSDTIDRVRAVLATLDAGGAPAIDDLVALTPPARNPGVAFELPWPWGGEMFELFDIRPLTYIIGPLGSGKTRLAQALASALPDAAFIGLDRLANDKGDADEPLKSSVDQILSVLVRNGATRSPALTALLIAMETETASILVVDMVEQGLDAATQAALGPHLRQRGPDTRPLFLMTRSRAILDLAVMGPDEAILFCPANHSPPHRVAPYPGAPGYEAVATCLASPEVRARTEGVIAWRAV